MTPQEIINDWLKRRGWAVICDNSFFLHDLNVRITTESEHVTVYDIRNRYDISKPDLEIPYSDPSIFDILGSLIRNNLIEYFLDSHWDRKSDCEFYSPRYDATVFVYRGHMKLVSGKSYLIPYKGNFISILNYRLKAIEMI